MKALWLFFLVLPALAWGGIVSYSQDTSDFANPERGWYPAFYYYGHGNGSNDDLSATNFNHAVSSASNYSGDTHITLLQRIYCLGGIKGGTSYSAQPLDANVLDDITADFSTARSLGIKLILRFSYNEGPIGAADASESVILNHISQLAPLLQANDDVIAYMEAGFIGTWGEWHDSTNGLTGVGDNNIVTGETDILNALLGALPTDRMVAVRYPGYTLQIFNTSTPIAAANAFDGSNYSRVGTHDDCFEVDSGDGGTYDKGTSLGWSEPQFKAFLAQQNFSVQEGGETCGTSAYSGCANSVADLQSEHWSALHFQYEKNVIQGWVSGGCISQVDLGLGYRYRLTQSTVPDSALQGASLALSFQLSNDGFASCYNPRSLEVILRPSGQSGLGMAFAVTISAAAGTDPRFWQSGVSSTVSLSLSLPMSLAPGNYDLLLNLPDPKASLHANPAYAIRLADQGLWEAATGYNQLSQTVKILPCAACTPSPTPLPQGASLDLQALLPVPNPNPLALALELSSVADAIELKAYSQGMTCVRSLRVTGTWLPGWSHISIPAEWGRNLSNGHYYVTARAQRSGSSGKAKIVSFFVAR